MTECAGGARLPVAEASGRSQAQHVVADRPVARTKVMRLPQLATESSTAVRSIAARQGFSSLRRTKNTRSAAYFLVAEGARDGGARGGSGVEWLMRGLALR